MELPDPDPRILARKDRILARLRDVVGEGGLIADPVETKAYECDALSAYRCQPLAVVLPASTEEVAAVMRVSREEGIPVVPRGSGTSLAGGALPTADSIILGTSRLNRVLEVDYDNRFIRVEAGRTNLSVTQEVEADGFFYAPDPSSQLACAIAGNIAMNSGGAHCLKYGVTVNNLLGVKVVMADGEIVEIGGPWADLPGYDLLALLTGSEGQLGIVTEAVLRILPKPEGARPILLAFPSNEIAGAAVADIIRTGILPVAIEFMDKPVLEAVERFVGAGYPECEALVIVEVEGSDEEIDAELARIREIAERHDPIEIREARDEADAARIWAGRKSAFGAMGQINDYICLDGTVPVSRLPEVLKGIGELARKYNLGVGNVFHAGDGNMHPLILFNANDPEEFARAEAMGAEVLKLCVEVGGCLTGEHGVGVEKRDLMPAQFSTADLEAQMEVKDVFDPDWRLNPAKVFPLDLSAPRRKRGTQGKAA